MAAGGREPVTLRSLVRRLAGCPTQVDIPTTSIVTSNNNIRIET